MEFIDIHCHLIPAVDDGPADADESLRMGRLAAADGITTVVATPHIVEGVYSGMDIDQRISEIRAGFKHEGINVALATGAEVSMSHCLEADVETLKKLTIGDGDFILVETSGTTPAQLSDVVERIGMYGFYSVLAHPERTLYTVNEIGRLCAGAKDRNVFLQVTAASIEGLFGRKIQKKCMYLIKSGLVHFVATDAHSDFGRVPVMSNAYNILSQKAAGAADLLMQENPRRLLENKKPQSTGSGEMRSGKRMFFRNAGSGMGA